MVVVVVVCVCVCVWGGGGMQRCTSAVRRVVNVCTICHSIVTQEDAPGTFTMEDVADMTSAGHIVLVVGRNGSKTLSLI